MHLAAPGLDPGVLVVAEGGGQDAPAAAVQDCRALVRDAGFPCAVFALPSSSSTKRSIWINLARIDGSTGSDDSRVVETPTTRVKSTSGNGFDQARNFYHQEHRLGYHFVMDMLHVDSKDHHRLPRFNLLPEG
jgi:hypothetical protein